MTIQSRLALVGDIGGTHARFAISDIDELTISHFVSFRCAMFPSLPAAVAAYMDSIPHRPRMAGLAIAAPVVGEKLKLTNLPWTFTRAELRAAAGVEHLSLVNDFEAQALALPYLVPHDLHRIGGGEPDGHAPKVVLGPGTGLGVAGLVPSLSGWIALASEGGHVTFAAETAEELAIVDRLRDESGHVSAEHLISGPALLKVYRTLGMLRDLPDEAADSVEIVRLALADEDPVAVATLDYFVKWLGRFAGDMALAFGARGGVYLGGGIVPHIIGALETSGFRKAFEDKGESSAYLAPIPVSIIKAGDTGLRGAAVALSLAVPA